MNMKSEMIPAGILELNQVPQHGLLLNIVNAIHNMAIQFYLLQSLIAMIVNIVLMV